MQDERALPPISLVAFDLDDTLFPERAFVRSGFRVVSDYLLRSGIVNRRLFSDLEAAFESGIRGRTFNHVLAAAGVEPTERLVADLVEVYRSRRLPDGVVRPDIHLYKDADRVLAHLAEQGVRVGLISDGPLVAQQAKIEALGLSERMDAITLTDAWGRDFWKPHPRAFREMAEHFSLSPAVCVYVADNPEKDFQGPAAARWLPSVWLRRHDGLYREAAVPERGLVSATVEDLSALPEVLAGLSSENGGTNG